MHRTNLRDERGIALPLMLSILLLVSILAAGAIGGALTTASSSDEDNRATRALAAANAGVDVAVFRLDGIAPPPTACLTTAPVAPTAGECPLTAPEGVGNGATFRYTVGTLQTGAGCVALPGAAVSAYRCITAVGTVGGVSRRVQVRVAGGSPQAAGLVGLNSVLLNNSVNATSCGPQPPRIGSNNSIRFVNSNTLYPVLQTGACTGAQWAVEYPATAVRSYGNSYQPNPMTVVERPTQWTIPPVDFAPSQTANNNTVAFTGTAGWTAATRALNVPSGTTRAIPPGTYNLCSLTAPNGGTISLPSGNVAGNVVRIYIDSPDRAGSGCPAGSGRMDLINSVRFNAPSGASQAELATRAKNLEIYVYGSSGPNGINRLSGNPPDCGDSPRKQFQEVVMCNSIDFAGQIHGPTSEILLHNSVRMDGTIAANDITLWNSVSFHRPAGLGNLGVSPASTQTAFAQCSGTAPTATDPESGCGT